MIYLLYGEDNYIKNELLKKIKKNFEELKLGINYIQIDENNSENIISDIETPAFGYEKKLIVAKNCNIVKKKNIVGEKLAEYIENNDVEDTDLVIIEDEVDKTSSIYKTLQKKATVKECNEKKPNEIITQIKSISSAYGVNIKENTAQYFIECVGTNMQDVINELRKLIEFEGKGGTITREDIDNLTVKKTESIIFDLTDNLGKKNIKEAMNVLHNLIYSKEPVQRILIMLYNHFKKLYIVKLSKGENVSQNLKLKPNQIFLVNKYQNQARFFEESELRKIIEEFINLDELSKNGNMDLNVGLESILCRYCSK